KAGPIQPVGVLQRTLTIKEAILGPRHRGLLSTIGALVVEFHSARDFAREAEILGRSIPVIEESLGPRSIALANGLEEWSRALFSSGRLADAVAAQQRAVDIW